MANYDIPQYPTKRLRYFNNQFLIDQDFIDDDAARISHERAFLRSLCVAGVCEGMQVTYPATNLPPSVGPGVAIDKAGRMIALDGAINALAKPDALADGDYFIHISFLEIEDAKAAGQGASDFTRWKQTPVINATAKSAALPDGAVVLGSCTVQNKVFVGSGTTIGRQYSGLRLPGPNQNAAATLRNNGATDDLALLGGALTIRRDARGDLGPTLTLLNGSTGGAGAGGAIDFNGYDPGTNDPSLRIQSLDDGHASSHLTFSTKQSGVATNKLVERMRLTCDGLLKFSNDQKDKIVIWDGGTTDRYGIGLNGSNINLFYPTTARFSLRQNSYSGTEVFSVDGSGTVTFSGAITPKVGNDASSGIYFPTNPGGGGGDEAFLRYYATTGETTKLMLGINNDPDDTLGLWQAGAERLTVSNGNVGIGTQTPNDILHVRHVDTVGTFESSTTGAAIRVVTSEGMNNQVQFANRSGGNAAIWVGTAGDALIVKKDGGVVVSKASGGVGDLTIENYLRFPGELKDKLLVYDNGTDRYGLGLNNSNINLFCPTYAHFSLRQNSYNGTEVFSVDGSGNVTLTGQIQNSLAVRRDVSGQLGPKLTLQNGGGGTGAACALDFNSYDPGTNDPALRIQAVDVGSFANFLKFFFKRSGANTNNLVERLRIEDNGQLTIYFDRGRWVFQTDGNLVKYDSNGKAIWSLGGSTGSSGIAGWS